MINHRITSSLVISLDSLATTISMIFLLFTGILSASMKIIFPSTRAEAPRMINDKDNEDDLEVSSDNPITRFVLLGECFFRLVVE